MQIGITHTEPSKRRTLEDQKGCLPPSTAPVDTSLWRCFLSEVKLYSTVRTKSCIGLARKSSSQPSIHVFTRGRREPPVSKSCQHRGFRAILLCAKPVYEEGFAKAISAFFPWLLGLPAPWPIFLWCSLFFLVCIIFHVLRLCVFPVCPKYLFNFMCNF